MKWEGMGCRGAEKEWCLAALHTLPGVMSRARWPYYLPPRFAGIMHTLAKQLLLE